MTTDLVRLLRADLLKLRRHRGQLALVTLLAVGAVLVVFAVRAARHAADPGHVPPAGGLLEFQNAIDFLALVGGAVGAILGATAGADDLERGAFRDLVATGRSRAQLFAVRLPAALGVVVPVLLAAAGVAAAAAIALAASAPAPGAADVLRGAAAVVAAGACTAALAVGLSAAAGARGPVVGAILTGYLAISPLLLMISFLGDARAAIPLGAAERIAGDSEPFGLAPGAAVAVLAAWALGALAFGAWRTHRAEL